MYLSYQPALRDDDDSVSGFVTYKKFEKKMLHILATKEYEPDTADVLLQAFRTIDTNNTGYIAYEVLEDLLTSRGTGFRPRELESFFAVAKDSESGNVYYEDYVALLTKVLTSS
jgi:Ca2+-binding EF-hand superfamily protein